MKKFSPSTIDDGSLFYNNQKIERTHFFIIPRSGSILIIMGYPIRGYFLLTATAEATYFSKSPRP